MWKNEINDEKKLRCLTLWWNAITVQISLDFNFVFHQVLLWCSSTDAQECLTTHKEPSPVSHKRQLCPDLSDDKLTSAYATSSRRCESETSCSTSCASCQVLHHDTRTFHEHVLGELCPDVGRGLGLVEQLQRSARHLTSWPSSLWWVIRVTLTDWTVTMQCNAMLMLWQCVYQC